MTEPIFPIRETGAARPTSVLSIIVYRHENAWVFDDARVGLTKEPFVSGIDVMLDRLTAGLPGAAAGFRLSFASLEFKGWQNSLKWLRADPVEGHWYRADDTGAEGWLCPALFCYFPSAPAKIYVAAAPLGHDSNVPS